MTRSTIASAALTLAAVPFAVGALLLHGTLRQRDLWLDLDPFEVDLQLRERNDD